MKTNILFLDIDGPLIPYRMGFLPDKVPESLLQTCNNPRHLSYCKFDDVAVAMLNSLYELHPFDTVISSSWADLFDRKTIEALFYHNELNLTLHEKWKTPRKMSSYRCNEIGWWLQENQHNDYIILDDHDSGTYLDEWYRDGILKNVFLVNPDTGIDTATYDKIREVVVKW